MAETYQTNLTQQFLARIAKQAYLPQQIFWNLKNKIIPAPFATFIKRPNDYDFVISISPERFVKVESDEKFKTNNQLLHQLKELVQEGKNIQDDLHA